MAIAKSKVHNMKTVGVTSSNDFNTIIAEKEERKKQNPEDPIKEAIIAIQLLFRLEQQTPLFPFNIAQKKKQKPHPTSETNYKPTQKKKKKNTIN